MSATSFDALSAVALMSRAAEESYLTAVLVAFLLDPRVSRMAFLLLRLSILGYAVTCVSTAFLIQSDISMRSCTSVHISYEAFWFVGALVTPWPPYAYTPLQVQTGSGQSPHCFGFSELCSERLLLCKDILPIHRTPIHRILDNTRCVHIADHKGS
ncbi:hypothetical protein DAEQUDRAFT_365683 [Daedalea quercina L-15889]|uniref:Uncharacterized protein n=1 Tax=Daedalea quercina L-15889 TaxID=1314783 RepID=A0A165P9D4_9APHY|nr:hypothetical protein DAEQUDRAFT_365683 [Daedalea quercina L-15889]